MGNFLKKIFVKVWITLATLIVMALAGLVILGIHLIKFFRKFRRFNKKTSENIVEDQPLVATERFSNC